MLNKHASGVLLSGGIVRGRCGVRFSGFEQLAPGRFDCVDDGLPRR